MGTPWEGSESVTDSAHLASSLFHFVENGVANIDDPPLSVVKEAIRALDGDEINTVSIGLRNGDSMEIGGGKQGRYVCYTRIKKSHPCYLYHLVNPDCPRDMKDLVHINMGDGESWTYPRCTIVSLETVLIAAECFCISGEMSPSLAWDNKLNFEIA